MFTHVFLGSNDIEKSRKFYDATMSVLGFQNVVPPEAGRLVYPGPQGTFIVAPPYNGEAAPNNARGAYLRDPDGNKVCAFNMGH